MKIVCIILGTRGDVQPMVALASQLIKKGHEVVIYAPPENEELVSKYNCPFVPFGPCIKKAIEENPEKQKGGVAVTISPKQGKKLTMDQMSLLPDMIRGADLVLGVGIVLGVHTAADIAMAPYRLVVFYPIMLGTTADDPFINRLLFGFGRLMFNLLMKGFINKHRRKFGLKPITDVWTHWVGDHVIVACDKELNPARKGVRFAFTQTGFMLLPSKNKLSDEIKAFLNAGKPPVYIGFGSNPIASPVKYSHMFEQVRDATQQRLIISKGWAGLQGTSSSEILYIDEVPFDLLFPSVAAAIYHGGTGTMAVIARAGIPQAAFPFMGDQFDNQKQIVKLGLGPKTCTFKKITAEAISEAVTACISNDTYRKNAINIAQQLQKVNGLEITIRLIEKDFS